MKKNPKRAATPPDYPVCLDCFGRIGVNCVCPPRPGHAIQQRIDGAIQGLFRQNRKPDGRSLRHRKVTPVGKKGHVPK